MHAFLFVVLCWTMTLSAFIAAGTRSSVISTNASVGKNCSLYAHPCVINGQLPLQDGRCYTPLERGPCPKGQVIVLDTDASATGLRGRCQWQQCPFGLVPSNGDCLKTSRARKRLCANGPLYLDPMGKPRCGEFSGWKSVLLAYDPCSNKKHGVTPPILKRQSRTVIEAIRTKHALCALDDTGLNCTKPVFGTSPNIPIVPEK